MTTLPLGGAPRAHSWLAAPAPSHARTAVVARALARSPTVCEEARCPNQGTCWALGTATFLALGRICTRACRFCAIASGRPLPLDPDEPDRVAAAVDALSLSYVVITSVDRDDLPDGGAAQLAAIVRAVRARAPVPVEVLAPDFAGARARVAEVVHSGVAVFAHNLETVARLSPTVRDRRASFAVSLDVLATAKAARPDVVTKSGLMLGLGETEDEVIDALIALRAVDVDIVTLGQYLRPTARHAPVVRYVEPALFDDLAADARSLGFRAVASGPLVRSSFAAAPLFHEARAERQARST